MSPSPHLFRSTFDRTRTQESSSFQKGRLGRMRPSQIKQINEWMNASSLRKKFDLFMSSTSFFSSGNTFASGNDTKKLSYFSIASINSSLNSVIQRSGEKTAEQSHHRDEIDEEEDFIRSLEVEKAKSGFSQRETEKIKVSKINLMEKIKKKSDNPLKRDNLTFSDLKSKKIKFKDLIEEYPPEKSDLEVIDLISNTPSTINTKSGPADSNVKRGSILKKSSFQSNNPLNIVQLGKNVSLSKISSFSLSSEESPTSPKLPERRT